MVVRGALVVVGALSLTFAVYLAVIMTETGSCGEVSVA